MSVKLSRGEVVLIAMDGDVEVPRCRSRDQTSEAVTRRRLRLVGNRGPEYRHHNSTEGRLEIVGSRIIMLHERNLLVHWK